MEPIKFTWGKRKEYEGTYWWRKELRKRLKEININIKNENTKK